MLSLFRRRKTTALPPTPPGVKEILDEGDAAIAAGDHAGGRALYERALALDPPNLYAHWKLADSHLDTSEIESAVEWCERGLAIDPRQIGLLLLRARLAERTADPQLALELYERIRDIDATVEDLEFNVSNQLFWLGRVDEGLRELDRAIERKPDAVHLRDNRLFVLNYLDTIGPEDVARRHREWGREIEARIPAFADWPNVRDPSRKLRIGYVSPDFRSHAVAHFLQPLFAAHNREAFEIHCFDTSTGKPDAVTEQLRATGHRWHAAGSMDDEQLAASIRAEAIDVLVDLSGHSRLNRLLAFARKPTPVQATWLGYLATTGLSRIDYRISDRYLDPPGLTEPLYSETLVRLPHHACIALPREMADPGPLPAWNNGFVTFGSFNNWAKVTPSMKDTWARLLARVPESRLLVVAMGGQNDAHRRAIAADFERRGIATHRIVVSPTKLPLERYLDVIKDADVALDPFPYGGGTTTLHSLWMGVPVVTLAGRSAFSRNSVGPLAACGLGHLVAASPDEYVEKAARLVASLPILANLRVVLRDRILRSRVVDATSFARSMEAGYRAMWRQWCEGRREAIEIG